MTLPTRITRRIRPSSSGCWEWDGAHNTHGYGSVWWEGAMRPVHVLVYEDRVGPVPPGLELDHTCNNKGCCNPDHTEPVTHGENGRRSSYAERRREATACARGHEFTAENTYITKRGGRCCKPCRRINQSKTRKAA